MPNPLSSRSVHHVHLGGRFRHFCFGVGGGEVIALLALEGV